MLGYSAKLIEEMSTKKKPAIVRQEDWIRKGYWMIGNTYINQSRDSLFASISHRTTTWVSSSKRGKQAWLLFPTEDFPQAGVVGIHDVTDNARFPGPTVSW